MAYLLFIPFIAAGVIALLRVLFGRCVMRHIIAVCIGVVVGLIFAFSLLLGGTGSDGLVKHILDFVNAPSMLAYSWFPSDVWWPFHFTYWAFLCGLVSFGVARIAAKMAGDE